MLAGIIVGYYLSLIDSIASYMDEFYKVTTKKKD